METRDCNGRRLFGVCRVGFEDGARRVIWGVRAWEGGGVGRGRRGVFETLRIRMSLGYYSATMLLDILWRSLEEMG